jgi:hypothetical protein
MTVRRRRIEAPLSHRDAPDALAPNRGSPFGDLRIQLRADEFDVLAALQRFPFIWDYSVIPYERKTR